jgi:hypothetical protein
VESAVVPVTVRKWRSRTPKSAPSALSPCSQNCSYLTLFFGRLDDDADDFEDDFELDMDIEEEMDTEQNAPPAEDITDVSPRTQILLETN